MSRTPFGASRKAARAEAAAAAAAAAAAGASPATAKSVRTARSAKAVVKRRRRLIALGAVTAVLCASGGGVVYAMNRTDSGNFRTVVAATGTVSQSLAVTGTVAPTTRKDAAFSVGGT
ncbi:hypothetical protein QN357_19280, partial [Cryobacterium sp. RTC2.1]